MRFPEEITDDAVLRLRRIEGQIRGIQRMLAEGQECDAVVTQLAAAKGALDRVSFRLMAAGMRHCVASQADPVDSGDDAVAQPNGNGNAPLDPALSLDELEKLFLKLS